MASPANKQAASYRPQQQQPTTDRYRDIQQALADRGYFAGPVDGNWSSSSVDALKRFQHDQNLTEDGKVGSLSLIALGLGPKRDPAPPPASTPVGPAAATTAAPADVSGPSTPPPPPVAPDGDPQ